MMLDRRNLLEMAEKEVTDFVGDFFTALELAEKSGKQSDPITEFIRYRIALWQQNGGLINKLADTAGLTKSMPSQIKARTSAATLDSAPKFAAVFGYGDLANLAVAAGAWWDSSDRHVIPSVAVRDPQAEAIRLVQPYGITQQQIARVLERYPKAEYEHKDTLWWLAKFHESRSDDADAASVVRAVKSAKAASLRRVVRSREDIRIAAKVAREKAKPATTNDLVKRRQKRDAG